MVSENQEVHAELIISEVSNTPLDASGFEFQFYSLSSVARLI